MAGLFSLASSTELPQPDQPDGKLVSHPRPGSRSKGGSRGVPTRRAGQTGGGYAARVYWSGVLVNRMLMAASWHAFGAVTATTAVLDSARRY